MRPNYPLSDNTKTLSLLLSWTTAARGRWLLVVVPLRYQVLDGRDNAPARFGTIESVKLFASAGFQAMVSNTDLTPVGGPRAFDGEFIDPARDPRYTFQFYVFIPSAATAKSNVLMGVYGQGMATAVAEPAGGTWPTVEALPAPSNCLTVRNIAGEKIPVRITEQTPASVGPQGPPGAPGEDGAPGTDGSDGLSAVAEAPTNPQYRLSALAAPAGGVFAVTVNGGTPANVSITPGDTANTVRTALEALADIVTAVVTGSTPALGSGVDQTGSGTARSQTFYTAGYEANKAFDNNPATSFAAGGTLPQRLDYDFGLGNEKIINYHSVTPFSAGGTANGNAPKGIELYGSNVVSPSASTETDWTLLDTQSITWTSDAKRGWTFTNTTPYRWIRHKYTVMNTPGPNVQAVEVEFGTNAATATGNYDLEVKNPAGATLAISTSSTGWSTTNLVPGDMGENGAVTPPDKKNLNSIEAPVAATTLGALSKKVEIFDAAGNSIGFVPVYATIT